MPRNRSHVKITSTVKHHPPQTRQAIQQIQILHCFPHTRCDNKSAKMAKDPFVRQQLRRVDNEHAPAQWSVSQHFLGISSRIEVLPRIDEFVLHTPTWILSVVH